MYFNNSKHRTSIKDLRTIVCNSKFLYTVKRVLFAGVNTLTNRKRKRGEYGLYDAEQRAKIAKLAIDIGRTKVVAYNSRQCNFRG